MIEISIKGASTSLEGLERWMGRLSSTRFTADLTQAVATVAAELTAERFETETTPDGKAWAPRKYAYPWKPLQKTGLLRTSLKSGTAGDKAFVSTDVPYAGYQFHGTQRIAPRPVLPEQGKLPPDYAARMSAAIAKAIEDAKR